jgi:hypothetical protein
VSRHRFPSLLLAPALLLILFGACWAGAQTKLTLSDAYLDIRSSVHILYSDGAQVQPPKEKGQASCESLKVAEDKETVGWLVDFENDGTSYALTLIVFRDKKVLQRFGDSDVDVIEDWQFRAGGKQVAFVTNALHGGGRAHYELHDVEKGTLLAKWDGPLSERSPAWTRGLWDQDAE